MYFNFIGISISPSNTYRTRSEGSRHNLWRWFSGSAWSVDAGGSQWCRHAVALSLKPPPYATICLALQPQPLAVAQFSVPYVLLPHNNDILTTCTSSTDQEVPGVCFHRSEIEWRFRNKFCTHLHVNLSTFSLSWSIGHALTSSILCQELQSQQLGSSWLGDIFWSPFLPNPVVVTMSLDSFYAPHESLEFRSVEAGPSFSMSRFSQVLSTKSYSSNSCTFWASGTSTARSLWPIRRTCLLRDS